MVLYTRLAVVLIAMASLSLLGCGGNNFSNVEVSGKVTSGGAPVAGIRVVFTPEPINGNNNPGPWAMGLTNEQGEYSLTDRYKHIGAVAGPHGVSFSYDDVSEDADDEIAADLAEAKGEDGSKAALAEAKQQLAELNQKRKGRPRVSDDFTIPFVVPAGGTTEANFDLPAR